MFVCMKSGHLTNQDTYFCPKSVWNTGTYLLILLSSLKFEEAESEGVALGEDLRTQVAQRESHSSAGDCNLSGVVRSSLDLVCPPPIRGEGATFEVSREEERPPQAVCTSSRESETQDSELIPEGGERDTEEISTVSTAGGDEQQNEPRMNSIPRSKKVLYTNSLSIHLPLEVYIALHCLI